LTEVDDLGDVLDHISVSIRGSGPLSTRLSDTAIHSTTQRMGCPNVVWGKQDTSRWFALRGGLGYNTPIPKGGAHDEAICVDARVQ